MGQSHGCRQIRSRYPVTRDAAWHDAPQPPRPRTYPLHQYEQSSSPPGVRAVATAADFPIMAKGGIDFAQLQGNARMIAENVLAHAKVLYKGHAVAATNRHIAADALQLIEV